MTEDSTEINIDCGRTWNPWDCSNCPRGFKKKQRCMQLADEQPAADRGVVSKRQQEASAAIKEEAEKLAAQTQSF